MATIKFEVPPMYGDHHVIEVRRLLLSQPGVSQVYASSSFHIVEIEYDASQLQPQQLESVLAQAGYLEALPTAIESGIAANEDKAGAFFRHTTAYATTGKTISFAQQIVADQKRPLWPCPGVGVLSPEE